MFSVIIPTHNEAEYLGSLLQSIKNQTLKPKQIIVADNHSTDQTRQIAKKFNCQVVKGGNPSQGRNAGAQVASQPILVFLDADTLLPQADFFQKLIKSFQLQKAHLATCCFTPLENGHPLMILFHSFTNLNKKFNHWLTQHTHKITGDFGCCLIVKKDLFNQLKSFDENLPAGEDSDFLIRAARLGYSYHLIPLYLKVSVRRALNTNLISGLKQAFFAIAFLGPKFFNKPHSQSLYALYLQERNKWQK